MVVSLRAQSAFRFVEGNGILITLSIQGMLLHRHLLLRVVLRFPLSLQHVALVVGQFSLFLALELTGVLLPVEYSHGILYILLLLKLLLLLAFVFLLSVQSP